MPRSGDNNQIGSPGPRTTLPAPSGEDYLPLRDLDKKLLGKYRAALSHGGESLGRGLYQYLLANPEAERTPPLPENALDDLIQAQFEHFHALLDHPRHHYVALARHYQQLGIAPSQVVSAYLCHLNHLHTLARTSSHIKDAHREALEDILTRLVFRDMGELLAVYWKMQPSARPMSDLSPDGSGMDTANSLLGNIPQMLWSMDVVENRLIYANSALRALCQGEIEIPIPCLSHLGSGEQKRVMDAWQRALGGNIAEIECEQTDQQGHTRWFRRIFHPYKNEEGRLLRIDAIMEDTTEIKQTLDRLHALTFTDTLTGLPNRNLFYDKLEQTIKQAANEDGQAVLIMLDLDHFKEINDTLGHPVGDAILKLAAARFQYVLRESDMLARLGDDEFAIVAGNKHGQRVAERIAKKLLDTLHKPFDYDGGELYIGASLGIALYPEHGLDASTLMSRAHVALDSSKRKAMGYLFYDAATDTNTQQRLHLAGELRHALENHELELYYQPKINFVSGVVEGVEALLRWRHPQHGLVSPEEFIPLAERSGLIKPITDWVIKTAGRQYLIWRQAGYQLRLAVNISGRVFQDPKLIERIKSTLLELDAPLDGLEIEITEHELMSDISYASELLGKITELGISIAIDDFGTGYSSLAYLKELPLNTLKIDKSFILNMANDENDAVIVRSMIDLAHNLGRQIVAEGIENRATWNLLAALGCDCAQGYFISRPLPATELSSWLKESPWSAAELAGC